MSLVDPPSNSSAGRLAAAGATQDCPRPIRLSAGLVTDTLVGIEMAALSGGAVLAQWLCELTWFSGPLRQESYLLPGIACALLTWYVLRALRLTESGALMRGLAEWRSLLFALALGFLLLIAAAFVLKVSANYSRVWLLVWMGLSGGLLLAGRALGRQLLLALARAGYTERRICVVSASAPGPGLLQSVGSAPGARLVRVLQIAPLVVPSAPVSAAGCGASGHDSPLAGVLEACKRNEIDEVVLVLGTFDGDQIRHMIGELSALSVDVWLCTDEIALDVPVRELWRVGRLNLLKVKDRPIGGWGSVAKLALDYCLAAVCLVVLAPLLALIAVAIKLDTPGPAFFRQRRHGYNEQEISVFKFRTMTVCEDGPVVRQAQRADDRITWTGHILRRTSLDELPQLLNVLRGEMSLVGPRPHALAHNDYYRSRVSSYASRHRVKPGITGLSQINGLRGETDTSGKMEARVQMDLQYIENWSIWLDLKILVQTPFFGLVGKNAF